MTRANRPPPERVHSSTVKYTPGTAFALARIATRLGRQSWRSILAGLADGSLIAVKLRDLSLAPTGEILDSLAMRESQHRALLDVCREHRTDYRGRPSISMLLYAIAVGDIAVLPASPSAEG